MGNLTRKPVQVLLNEVTAKTLTIKNPGANAILVIENYGTIKLVDLQRVYKHTTGASTPKTQVLIMKPYYPADKENFEAGFEVERTRELTGFAADFLSDVKRYAGIVTRLGAAEGDFVNKLDSVEITTQIAAMIRKHESAIVVGTAQIPVTLTAAQNIALTIEAPELNKSVVITAADTIDTIAELKTKIDGSVLAGLVTVNTVNSTIETAYGLKLSGATNIVFGYSEIKLVGKQAIPSFMVKDIDGVATVKSITEADRAEFSQKDVARLFPIKWEHAGTQPLVPIPGVDYNKYRFEIKHNMGYALDGANHLDSYIEQVEFYLPKSVAEATNGTNWDNKIYSFLGTSGHDRSKFVHA